MMMRQKRSRPEPATHKYNMRTLRMFKSNASLTRMSRLSGAAKATSAFPLGDRFFERAMADVKREVKGRKRAILEEKNAALAAEVAAYRAQNRSLNKIISVLEKELRRLELVDEEEEEEKARAAEVARKMRLKERPKLVYTVRRRVPSDEDEFEDSFESDASGPESIDDGHVPDSPAVDGRAEEEDEEEVEEVEVGEEVETLIEEVKECIEMSEEDAASTSMRHAGQVLSAKVVLSFEKLCRRLMWRNDQEAQKYCKEHHVEER
eukprot:g3689.t1